MSVKVHIPTPLRKFTNGNEKSLKSAHAADPTMETRAINSEARDHWGTCDRGLRSEAELVLDRLDMHSQKAFA